MTAPSSLSLSLSSNSEFSKDAYGRNGHGPAMRADRLTRMKTAATPREVYLRCRIFLFLRLSFFCSCSCYGIWGFLFGEQGHLDVKQGR
jgi:hypothetical protein